MSRNSIYIVMCLYFLIAGLLICFFDGTGDAGDSINHYLISKFSWQHPRLFFDHWGKPIFTLLSSPFAQFGLVGIKVFNVLMTGGALWFTWRIAQRLFPEAAIMTFVFYLFAPLPLVLTFSGLTEPLFAAILAGGLYFLLIKKADISASIIISFLPFVRSEGLIILGVWGLYFLLKKDWKPFVLLTSGHLFYSLIGWGFHKDLLWVFNEITYAQIEPAYGNGALNHFAVQLTYILGIPIYIALIGGLLVSIVKALSFKMEDYQLEKSVLILGGFIAFFIAHTLFWYLGIFKSMGLNRVFVGIMPLIVLLSVRGVNYLNKNVLKRFIGVKKIRYAIKVLLISYTLVFPFTPNPAAIKWPQDMSLLPEQKLIREELVPFLEELKVNDSMIYYYAHPYLSEALKIDPFNAQEYRPLDQFQLPYLSPQAILIWDNWFASIDNQVQEIELNQRTDLEVLRVFEMQGKRKIKFIVFRSKN